MATDMYLKWGNFAFDPGSLWVLASAVPNLNEAGEPISLQQRIQINGYVSGVGQAALTTAIQNLQAALSIPYQDLVFYQSNDQPSAHLLRNATSISGTRVTDGPNFPGTHGAEYATQRAFNFTAEADYFLAGTGKKLVSFMETLTMMGGDPFYVVREALNGPPQRSLVYPSSVYSAIQSGEAVGFREYPVAPPPLFPDKMRGGRDGRRIVAHAPQRRGRNYVNFRLTWEYIFESEEPLIGIPNLWVG